MNVLLASLRKYWTNWNRVYYGQVSYGPEQDSVLSEYRAELSTERVETTSMRPEFVVDQARSILPIAKHA